MIDIDGKSYTVDNPYHVLREITPQDVISEGYAGGLVGYMSYEAACYFEPTLDLPLHPKFETFQFGSFEDGLVLDRLTNELSYFHYGTNRFSVIHGLLALTGESPKRPRLVRVNDTLTEKEHGEILMHAQEDILKEQIITVSIGGKREFSLQGSALPVYRELRQFPADSLYCLKFGDTVIMGSADCRFLQMHDGLIRRRVLTGQTHAGKTKSGDAKRIQALVKSNNEIIRHQLMIDLVRNDIGRVARFGSLKHTEMELLSTEEYRYLSTEVTGIAEQEEDMFTVLASAFPAGESIGAPKLEAMRVILRNEVEPRGPFNGAVGWFGFNGDAAFTSTSRALFLKGAYAFTQSTNTLPSEQSLARQSIDRQRDIEFMNDIILRATRS